ncbi:MAG TPA: N-acetylmuramoyl-L-alanine amidase [Actinomycetota bacterium]|nr:N-acetylmuramoyl-L-alanine amidase [Actinomycetota bacterium]
MKHIRTLGRHWFPAALAAACVAVVASPAAFASGAGAAGARAATHFPPTVSRETQLPLGAMAGARPSVTRSNGGVRAARPVTTAPRRICASIDFTEVGVSWEQHGAPRRPVSATVSVSGGGASSPVLLRDEEFDGGPDPGSTERRRSLHATEPLWTGRGRCVEVSLHLPAGVTVAGARVAFLNTLGTAFGGPAVLTPLPIPAAAETDALPEQSSATKPTIISRKGWGADPGKINCFFGYAPALKMAFVHHTDTPNDYGPSQSAAIVRGIYAYHTDVHKWCDIGYNFLVDRYGRIFEGRQGGEDEPVIPAAVKGFNTDTVSVAAIGTFTTATPPPAMLGSIEHLLAWRLSLAGISPGATAYMESGGGIGVRWKKGTWVHLRTISGHRDANFTSCPGNRLYADLPAIRSAVAKLIHTSTGGTVVFAADAGSASQIFAENADGTDLRQVTNVAGGASDPALSPDGTRVAYVVGTETSANIWVKPLSGGTPQQVTDSSGFNGTPAWSPDGTQLAFTSDRGGNDDIWIVTLKSGSLRQVTENPATDTDPTWSRLGTGLAFASNRTGNFDIWTVSLSSGVLTQRTTDPGDDTQPAWAPDGTEIAFVSNRTGNDDIWAQDVESGKIRQITTDPSDDQAPSWSGNSGRIAFESDRSGTEQIYVRNINTTGALQLTTAGGADPGWRR